MSNPADRTLPQDADREPGTREDGEAMPPAAIDPGIDHRGKATPADQPDSAAVDEDLAADQETMVKDATGF